jgi:hypothetical protein
MRRLLVFLAAALLLGAVVGAPSAASARSPHVFSPAAHPFGASLGEWQARWFTWFIEIPAPTNPIFDETGELCGINQSGPVWFLAPVAHSGTTTRECTVPAGKGLFALGLGNECSNVEPPPFHGDTEAELRACAALGYDELFGDATQSISVDGVAVPDLADRYRTQTPLFGYTLPPDNIYGLPPGPATMAISDGVATVVQPLPPGRHHVAVHIEAPLFGGTTDIIYNLNVVAG